jgi:hypothetical protein
VRTINLFVLVIGSLLLTACGDDKAESNDPAPAAPAAESAMPAESSEAMAMDDEYGRTVDHSRDEAEFELRRSIAGHDRMIEQYTADGYATDELEAHKAELMKSLDAL